MIDSALRYPEWKAPAEDGRVLLWPEAEELLRDARQAHERLSKSDSVRIQNIPLPELRRRQRAWLGHESLSTTNVYAEADLEMKAKALAQCEVSDGATSPPWQEDQDLMAFLQSL